MDKKDKENCNVDLSKARVRDLVKIMSFKNDTGEWMKDMMVFCDIVSEKDVMDMNLDVGEAELPPIFNAVLGEATAYIQKITGLIELGQMMNKIDDLLDDANTVSD